MANVRFPRFLLEKSQDINLLVTNLLRKLMKKISSSAYCPKNDPKIPKALSRLDKKFENFWTNFRQIFRQLQPPNSIEIKNKRNYLVVNSQKITKNHNSLIKAYNRKFENFWTNIR